MCSIRNTNGIQFFNFNFFFAFSHPTEILSNNLSWGWLIGVIQNTELSPKKKMNPASFQGYWHHQIQQETIIRRLHTTIQTRQWKLLFFQPRLKYPIRLIRFPLILGITFEELEFHSPTIPLSPVIRIDLYIWWPLISPSLICPPLAQPRRRHLWKTQIQLTSFDTFGSIRNNQSYIRLTFHQMQNIYMQFMKYSPFSH